MTYSIVDARCNPRGLGHRFGHNGIFKEIDEIFDEVFKDFPISFVRSQYEGFPVSNVLVNQNGDFRIELAVTGYDPDDIEVSLDDRILIVRGGIKDLPETEENENTFRYIHQRIKGRHKFEKRYTIPKQLNLEAIEVKNKNGLLTISLPFDNEKKTEKKLKIQL
jgi:HSP20 family protein